MLSRHLAWAYRQHRCALLKAVRVPSHRHTRNDSEIIKRAIDAVGRGAGLAALIPWDGLMMRLEHR
jgi:hypothetical protein